MASPPAGRRGVASWLPLACVAATLLIGLCGSSPAGEKGPFFKVVVHAANPVTSITADELSRLFLKKQGRWPDGTPVQPVDLLPDSRVREAFSMKVHGRPVAAVKTFWQKQVFSGRELPPPEKPTDRDVMAFVRSGRGAVGYVAAGAALVEGVKVLSILR